MTMSFQAYLDNIQVKTGVTPQEFVKLAEKQKILKEGVKAGDIVAWLKKILISGMDMPWRL